MKNPRKPGNPARSGTEPAAGPDVPPTPPTTAWDRFTAWLARPVSGASLAAMRIAFGLVMALEARSLVRPSQITSGAIPLETYYTGADIQFHFPYEGFGWLPLFSPAVMRALVWVLGLSGLLMAAGLFYRVAAAGVFLTWGYFFAVESTRTYWQSHYYIELLCSFLLLWMPAARRLSLDAWRNRGKGGSNTVPFWTLALLRGQLIVMYFYGGVAKISADWLLDAVPLRWRFHDEHMLAPLRPHLGPGMLGLLAGILHHPAFAYAIAYVGLVFDLAIGFLLLVPRFRILGILMMGIFHTTNRLLLYDNIDWFPLVGFTTALIFLEPDWPERVGRWLRRPRITPPDWGWFAAGIVLVPGLGAALGWKVPPTRHPATPSKATPLPRAVAPFFLAWMVWQSLFPLRHYFIPGDARATYEGLRFSWRLKSDEHDADGLALFVRDPKIISADGTNATRIHWSGWRGDRILHRQVRPGRVDWAGLPELVPTLEPVVGARILFNPLAGPRPPRTEAEARERVRTLWQQLYGRPPASVRRTVPLFQILDAMSGALRGGGMADEAASAAQVATLARQLELPGRDPVGDTARRAAVQTLFGTFRNRDQGGSLAPYLRVMPPFALEGEPTGAVPFLVIEDPALVRLRPAQAAEFVAGAWRTPPGAVARPNLTEEPDGATLVVHYGNLGAEARDLLPLRLITDDAERPDQPPTILWNCLRDLPQSKFLHVSIQPFYLRRYARRIAALWEQEYGRRPKVTALTRMSVNRRPFQPIVDPEADLASVPERWFRHNDWVMDLATPRVPREALQFP